MSSLAKVTAGLTLLQALGPSATAHAANVRLDVRHQIVSAEEERDVYKLFYAGAPGETNLPRRSCPRAR